MGPPAQIRTEKGFFGSKYVIDLLLSEQHHLS